MRGFGPWGEAHRQEIVSAVSSHERSQSTLYLSFGGKLRFRTRKGQTSTEPLRNTCTPSAEKCKATVRSSSKYPNHQLPIQLFGHTLLPQVFHSCPLPNILDPIRPRFIQQCSRISHLLRVYLVCIKQSQTWDNG